MRTNGQPSWQLFPERWSLSNPNRIKTQGDTSPKFLNQKQATENHIRTKTPVKKKKNNQKTCIWGFRPNLAQAGLYGHRRWIEACNLEALYYLCSKKKVLISCAVTTQLICTLCFRICPKRISPKCVSHFIVKHICRCLYMVFFIVLVIKPTRSNFYY